MIDTGIRRGYFISSKPQREGRKKVAPWASRQAGQPRGRGRAFGRSFATFPSAQFFKEYRYGTPFRVQETMGVVLEVE